MVPEGESKIGKRKTGGDFFDSCKTFVHRNVVGHIGDRGEKQLCCSVGVKVFHVIQPAAGCSPLIDSAGGGAVDPQETCRHDLSNLKKSMLVSEETV